MASKSDKRIVWCIRELFDGFIIEGALLKYSAIMPTVVIHVVINDGILKHKILLLKEKLVDIPNLNNKYKNSIDNFVKRFTRAELIDFLKSKTKNPIILQSLELLQRVQT